MHEPTDSPTLPGLDEPELVHIREVNGVRLVSVREDALYVALLERRTGFHTVLARDAHGWYASRWREGICAGRTSHYYQLADALTAAARRRWVERE